MPRGPKGEKRPADVIGAAVMVGKIATGEIEDTKRDPGTEAKQDCKERRQEAVGVPRRLALLL
jgi:hypothetical protein